ncbi:hypothetical protein [Sinorhizobium terangae]|uniref:hypothetical protein n=1 Tax=Sinorhizobium terangae TaxID=110322 RepID=UPI0024B0E08D|nr:hypothetical protein [Sinorhizobium terangae]WFU52051.1 hypothetical protein QA637_29380 [Sinorhizobium terangae]
MCSQVRCKLHWECGLQRADHVEVANFFCIVGPTGAFNAKRLEGSRSWTGALRDRLRLERCRCSFGRTEPSSRSTWLLGRSAQTALHLLGIRRRSSSVLHAEILVVVADVKPTSCTGEETEERQAKATYDCRKA